MNKLSMISSRNKGVWRHQDPPRVLWAIEHPVGDDVTYVSSEWTLSFRLCMLGDEEIEILIVHASKRLLYPVETRLIAEFPPVGTTTPAPTSLSACLLSL